MSKKPLKSLILKKHTLCSRAICCNLVWIWSFNGAKPSTGSNNCGNTEWPEKENYDLKKNDFMCICLNDKVINHL